MLQKQKIIPNPLKCESLAWTCSLNPASYEFQGVPSSINTSEHHTLANFKFMLSEELTFFKHLKSILMNTREKPRECDSHVNFKLQVPQMWTCLFLLKLVIIKVNLLKLIWDIQPNKRFPLTRALKILCLLLPSAKCFSDTVYLILTLSWGTVKKSLSSFPRWRNWNKHS